MLDSEERLCECRHPERWIADPHFPIGFDEEMNEYYIRFEKGGQAIMRYCFWCGGSLPKSKRGALFTTPSELEMVEVQTLLQDAKSHEDVLRILGPPDEVVELGGSFTGPDNTISTWDSHYLYAKRWETLVLKVPKIREGRFSYSMSGHCLGRPDAVPEI